MTNKSTKRALLSSVVALFLCFSMLLGTTYAWFTDSVTSGSNVIKAGNLDIVVEYTLDGENWKNLDGATDLFQKGLWEPGHTEVVALRIKNNGTLELKYAANMNIVKETKGETKDGADIVLSDILTVSTLTQEALDENGNANMVGEIALGLAFSGENRVAYENTTTFKAGNVLGKDNNLQPGAAHYLIIKVDMAETVGNEANAKDKDSVPSIEFGINVLATQYTSESDSFGSNYDKDAIYYDALATTDAELKAAIIDPKCKVIAVKGDLTYDWGANSYENSEALYMKGKTFVGFDKNSSITFAGYGSANPITDVTLKNITVKDITVGDNESSWEHGYLEFVSLKAQNVVFADPIMLDGNSKLVNCSMINNASSWYGIWIEGGNTVIEDCTFSGTRSIKIHEAYSSDVESVVIDNCKIGALSEKPGVVIGDLDATTKVTIKNSTFVSCQPGDQGLYSYETDTDVTTFNFTYEGNVVASYVENGTDLKDAIVDNANVILSGGEYALPTLSGKTGVTIEGAADGSTVIGGESASTGFGGNFGKDTTIKNVTFAGSTNGVRYSYAQGGTSTFENCTFAGDSTYGFHMDQSNGATLIFNDCTFSGFNAFAGDLEKVIFNNCTFLHNGNYGHTNIWSVAEFNNCTFGDKASAGPRDSGKLYFDGVEESYHHEYIGSAESLFAFAESVNEGGDSWKGQKVILVDDIDLGNAAWTPIGQTGATEFKGIFDGNNHTIYNLNVDSSAQTGAHYSSGLFGWAESGVTIQNVKVNGAKIVGNHNVAVIVGYTYSGKIINCHVTNAEIVCNHANGDACGDKAGTIAGYTADEARLIGCTASDSTVKAGRDAGQLFGLAYTNSVSDCSATNVVVSATGDCNKAGNINNAIIGRVMD